MCRRTVCVLRGNVSVEDTSHEHVRSWRITRSFIFVYVCEYLCLSFRAAQPWLLLQLAGGCPRGGQPRPPDRPARPHCDPQGGTSDPVTDSLPPFIPSIQKHRRCRCQNLSVSHSLHVRVEPTPCQIHLVVVGVKDTLPYLRSFDTLASYSSFLLTSCTVPADRVRAHSTQCSEASLLLSLVSQ